MSTEAFDLQSLLKKWTLQSNGGSKNNLRHFLSWLLLSHRNNDEEITFRDKNTEVTVVDALCDTDEETLDREGLRHQIGTNPENGAPFWHLFWGDQFIGSVCAKADRRGWGRLATDLDLEEHYFEPSKNGFELESFCGSTKHINNALVLLTDQPASSLTCKNCLHYAPKFKKNSQIIDKQYSSRRNSTNNLFIDTGTQNFEKIYPSDPLSAKLRNIKQVFRCMVKPKEKSNGPEFGTILIVSFFNLLTFYLLWHFWKNN
jgi:hypothetical protein